MTCAGPEFGWTDAPAGPIFCAYHAPLGPPRRYAVLLCDPLGPDRMNLHLSYRALAESFARAGFPSLRFDPFGTADSSGSPRDPRWPGTWKADATAAAKLLLERSGATKLALFGARVGGTLAMTMDDVDAIMLWGPYKSGKQFLRSEKALTRVVSANAGGRKPRSAREGDAEYLGFLYTESAQTTLHELNPFEGTRSYTPNIKYVAWDSDDHAESLVQRWSNAGVNLSFDSPIGFVSDESIHQQVVPIPLIENCVAWLQGIDSEATSNPASMAQPAAPVPSRTISSPFSFEASASPGQTVREEVVHFGADSGLFGIVTHAARLDEESSHPHAHEEHATKGRALILVSGGNNHRPGINRNYTEWARRLAQSGITSLRFDIRGLGDSPALEPSDLNQLYRDETRADVIDAVECMSERFRCDEITVGGLCAGAYQAFHAARIDPRINRLILLDLLRWDPDTNYRPATGFIARRRAELARWTARIASMSRSSAPRRTTSLLTRGLLEITDRGADVLAISCIEGGGFELVKNALGHDRVGLEASGHFSLESVSDTNHIFTPLWSQEWLGDRIEMFLTVHRE